MGKAVKIIDVDESGNKFVLLEEVLHDIFAKVPDDLPVGIIGVVGAFRTGKSFLLDFFLRYLKNTDGTVLDENLEVEEREPRWITKEAKLEGTDDKSGTGFKWSSGTERCTTGIWLWNEHFLRIDPATKKPMAVFLMDTQGMHDHETGQYLTASIFGLGSLLSSYTVFNVSMQIQEDHIQQLALFSDYARIALNEAHDQTTGKTSHAFQKLEFLVRDFPNFSSACKDMSSFQIAMDSYFENVMNKKFQKDLKEVRDQIELCYEQIRCYCLPYPGENVAEQDAKFDGVVKRIRPKFRRFLGDYVRKVFNDRLCIKKVQGEEVTAMKLFEFVKVYCNLFQKSEIFPEAMTLFRATQETSIAFATGKAIRKYNEYMESAAVGSTFLEEREFNAAQQQALELSFLSFNENTKRANEEFKAESLEKLKELLDERYDNYDRLNRLKRQEEEKLVQAQGWYEDKMNFTNQKSKKAFRLHLTRYKEIIRQLEEIFHKAIKVYSNEMDRNNAEQDYQLEEDHLKVHAIAAGQALTGYDTSIAKQSNICVTLRTELWNNLQMSLFRYQQLNEEKRELIEQEVVVRIEEAVQVYAESMQAAGIPYSYLNYEQFDAHDRMGRQQAFSYYEEYINSIHKSFHDKEKKILHDRTNNLFNDRKKKLRRWSYYNEDQIEKRCHCKFFDKGTNKLETAVRLKSLEYQRMNRLNRSKAED